MNKTTLLTALDKNNEFNSIPTSTIRSLFTNKLFLPINKVLMEDQDSRLFEIYNPSDLGNSTLYLLLNLRENYPDFKIRLENVDTTLLENYDIDFAVLMLYLNGQTNSMSLKIVESGDDYIIFEPDYNDELLEANNSKSHSIFDDMIAEGCLYISLMPQEWNL